MLNDILAVIKKETIEIYDSQTMQVLLVLTGLMVLIPLIPLIVSVLVLLVLIVDPGAGAGIVTGLNSTVSGMQSPMSQSYEADPASGSLLWIAIYVELLLLFPSKVVSEIIGGEIEKSNAEPILSTPVTTRDLIIGKVLASNVAPQIPLYIGVVISSILFALLRYGDTTPLPTLWQYVSILFVLVPLCTLADTMIVATVRLIFRKGFIQRTFTSVLTPSSVVSFTVLGGVLMNKLNFLNMFVSDACLVLLVIVVGCFPLLVLAYDRDNIIFKMKEA